MTENLRICFVGLGSIAKRHIRNTTDYLVKKGIGYEIDLLRSGKGKAIDKEIATLVDRILYSEDEIHDYYDVVFVTNPTAMHEYTVYQFRNKTKAFFIEKPVFHTSEIDVNRLDLRKGTLYYVACPLRYTKVIQYLKHNVDFNNAISIQVISSSYLPDWREGVDYRNTYSARKELGGGVSIDLIHEWDYIIYLMGMPKNVFSIVKRVSDLEINSDDIAVYIGEYEDKIVEIHLDYFTHKPVRQITIRTNENMIEADLINGVIKYSNSDEEIILSEPRNEIYVKEIEHFFDIFKTHTVSTNDIDQALAVLRIAEGK